MSGNRDPVIWAPGERGRRVRARFSSRAKVARLSPCNRLIDRPSARLSTWSFNVSLATVSPSGDGGRAALTEAASRNREELWACEGRCVKIAARRPLLTFNRRLQIARKLTEFFCTAAVAKSVQGCWKRGSRQRGGRDKRHVSVMREQAR